MSNRTQRGYSVTEELHGILRHLSRIDDTQIAEQLEDAVLALISQRIASRKRVSIEMVNFYLLSIGVQVVE